MGTPSRFSAALLSIICLTCAASAQQSPTPAPGPGIGAPAPTAAGPMSSTPDSASSAPAVASTGVAASVTPVAPAIDPKAAVQSILSMFSLNLAVNVDATGKPLPADGTWGAQTQFPSGLPHACALARVPCVKVIYRVPADNIVCEWTLGLVKVIDPQPDGTIKHVTKQMLLDENDAAARYTMRRAWPYGETPPLPSYKQAPEYPRIASGAHVGGQVTVRVVVGPDGLVKSVVALNGPAMLHASAVDAARQWKFEPLAIGSQPTSFQLDEYFNYAAGKTGFSSSMDPSGKVVVQETDSRLGVGFRTDGASSGNWQTCAATGCANAAPPTPK